MTAPRFVFQVAMEMGVTDVPGPGDWTDLSDRILQCRGSRGRTTELDEFGVGSATVVLDNSDRMLDPSVAGALNELAADKGLPGCPAQLMIDWGGEVEWMVGVLGDEPWIPDDAPHGATGTVTVEIVDTMARDAQMGLPDDVVRAAMLSAGPDWWGRRFTNLGTFDDWSGNNDPGGFVWGATPAYTSVDPLVPSTGLPGMQFHEMAVELPATWAGPVDDFTVLFCMRGGATAVNQVFARVPSTATTPGWRIRATGDGVSIQAEFFAPGGAFVVATSPIAATGMVRLQVEGGVAATLAITDANGTKQTTTLTSGSIPTGFDGSPRFGSDANTLTPAMAEMAYWSGQVVSTSILDGLGQVMAGNGWGLVPTLDLRIAAYQALAGSTSTVEIHPSSLPQLTAVDAMPATLAEGYRAGADAGRGVTYALRDGTIRVRTVEALTDPTLAAHYSTAVANLTDEPSPSGSPTPVRRSPVKISVVP